MGNSMSPSGTSDNSDMDFPNPQCLASNYFTDESSEEEFDWNPCCPERDRLSLVKIIDDMVTYMRGIFVTKEIQDVMKTVMREHFVYNTGAKIRSVHYNVGEVEEEDNKFHVCFAPRRELSANTNFVEFLEKLQLSPGHFFLHLGSGTGYLSTLAGLLIGASGINHGVEVNPEMLAYAEERQNAFRDHCVDLQKFEYCEPMFILGDCLKMEGDIRLYDRIFCSGMLPQGYENLLKLYLKEGGILIFPKTNRVLVNVKRVGKEQFDTQENNTSRPMDFYQFVSTSTDVPTVLPDELIPTLQQLSRGAIRQHIRSVQQSPMRKRDHNDSSSEPPRKRLYLSDDQVIPCPPTAIDNIGGSNSPQASSSNNTDNIGGSNSPQASPSNNPAGPSDNIGGSNSPQASSSDNAVSSESVDLSISDNPGCSNSPQASSGNNWAPLKSVDLSTSVNLDCSNSPQASSSGGSNNPETPTPNPDIESSSAMNHAPVQNSPETSALNPEMEAPSAMNHEPVQNSPETPAPNPEMEDLSAMNHEAVQNNPEISAPNPEMEDPSAMNHEAVQNNPEMEDPSAMNHEGIQNSPAAQENSNNQVIFYVNPQDDGDLSDSDSSLVSTVPYEDSTSDDFPSPAHIQPRRIRTLSYDSADSEGERDWRRRQSQRRREDDVLSSDPDLDEIFAPDSDADYCSDCDLELEKSVPQKVKPYNPNAIYPPSALNTKINTLPLPKHLKWYLKYKHCLVFPLQPTVAQ